MADTSTTSSGAAPQSKSVSPTVFWIVAVVLAIAIGVVYFLLNKDVTETRENINSAMKTAVADQDKKREEAIAATTKAFNAELAKQQEKIGKLEGGLEKTTGDLAKLSAAHDGTIAKVDTLKKEAMAKIAETASGLSQTNTNVQKVEVEVKYMKDNIAKINEKLAAVDKEIANLGTGQTALKEELQKERSELAKEIDTISKKSGVTELELKNLENKTQEFQIKVLNERARQASAALKKGDNKSLLEILDFKN